MTLRKLIATLQRLEASERAPVVVKLEAFRVANEMYSHWEISDVTLETIRWGKDDSFELKDGTERTKQVVVIS